mmetsp:Transcript_18865/g.51944  ORF Transcript_18865/g.51944 Transcript_18865/m.51944 type:complete len:305 (+) Transcript_18865:637-1551(+)
MKPIFGPRDRLQARGAQGGHREVERLDEAPLLGKQAEEDAQEHPEEEHGPDADEREVRPNKRLQPQAKALLLLVDLLQVLQRQLPAPQLGHLVHPVLQDLVDQWAPLRRCEAVVLGQHLIDRGIVLFDLLGHLPKDDPVVAHELPELRDAEAAVPLGVNPLAVCQQPLLQLVLRAGVPRDRHGHEEGQRAPDDGGARQDVEDGVQAAAVFGLREQPESDGEASLHRVVKTLLDAPAADRRRDSLAGRRAARLLRAVVGDSVDDRADEQPRDHDQEGQHQNLRPPRHDSYRCPGSGGRGRGPSEA